MHEPLYDDSTLELISEFQNKDLVERLWQYALSLEEYVIRLRVQINSLTPEDRRSPYPEPASDFAERFNDHPAFDQYSDILESENVEWTIPD